MNTLMKGNHTLEKIFTDEGGSFFSRTIDEILTQDLFNSFDANMREEQDSYKLEIATPGMTRNDITIKIDGSVMWISAQRQKKSNSWNIREFNSNHLRRSFTLPAQADTNNIQAKCRNGLLTIQIGKVKPKRTHRVIKIEGADTNTTILPDKTISWWSGIMHRIRQLFTVR